ncbi:MAG: hypothetical protein ACO1N0_21190 [Fluviicola sp.]
MKLKLVTIAILLLNGAFAQEKEQPLKNLFNEFHASVNHGFLNNRTFFGGGLGASHVFRADRVLGARVGLEFELFHIHTGNTSPPYSDETRRNQHFYLTSLTFPINLRLSFGKKIRFLFELGGRGGFVVSRYSTADVLRTGPNYETYFEHVKTNKVAVGLATVGVNSGIGTLIPLNEKFDLLVRPDVDANLFFFDDARIHLYARLCVGIHLK